MVFLSSEDAVISKKTSSSAPCASYAIAHSTGSPASRRFKNLVPLTTLPFVTSRQGIILFVNPDSDTLQHSKRFPKVKIFIADLAL